MQLTESQLQPDRLLNVREVASALSLSVPTVFRHVAEGKLPRPIKLGGSNRWPQSEILEVIERAKAQRETA